MPPSQSTAHESVCRDRGGRAGFASDQRTAHSNAGVGRLFAPFPQKIPEGTLW